MNKRKLKRGFTIVELMLAMVFLSALLLVIAVLTMNVINIYQKGLAIRAVNSTGRALVDEFSRAVGASPYSQLIEINESDQIVEVSMKKYYWQRTGVVRLRDDTKRAPINGVFCTGLYSYIWNTGYAINMAREYNDPSMLLSYKPTGGSAYNTFKLIKVPDRSRSVCEQYADDGIKTINQTSAPGDIATFTPKELLGKSEDELAIYDFAVFPPSQNRTTRQAFYSATFILATLRGGVDIFAQDGGSTGGDYCRRDAKNANQKLSFVTDFNYCAINKFNFAMRATGENEVPTWEED